jgi:Lysyl oxidase
MRQPLRNALALAFALALAPALAGGSASASAAELPDLEQLPPYKVRVVQRDGRSYLGFAAAVQNVGAGALRIRGYGGGSGMMAAQQLSEDGLQVLNPDVGTLRYVTTYGHNHWHYMGFMRYELRGLDVPGQTLDRKQGFCLGEAPFVDGWCARDKPTLISTDLGIRPSGTDIYEPNVEGQEIEIDPDTAPSGRYVLTSRVGPTGLLHETRTDNNVASTVIELRWPITGSQEVAPISSCIGEACAGAVPRPPVAPRRISTAVARRLARKALRRTIGRLPSKMRIRCRHARTRGSLCRVRIVRGRRSFNGTVRVWYVVEGAATRWYYSVNMVRRMRGCARSGRCTRRIRRVNRRGGTVPTRARAAAGTASPTPLVCRLAKRPRRAGIHP